MSKNIMITIIYSMTYLKLAPAGRLADDECVECAALAFGEHKPVSTSQESHVSR